MPSTKVSKITARIAGMAGTGSLGAAVAALTRFASAHAVPVAAWVALAAVIAVLADLARVLDYRRARLEIAAHAAEAQASAELAAARLAMYRTLVEKSAGEPGSSVDYRELFLADALHLAVEQNGVQPAGRTHGQLYGSRDGES